MKLNSDDILRQNFSTKTLGFNKEEVMAFLDLVSAEYEELSNENILLKKQLAEKGDQIQLINETRGEVKEVLNTLQQFSKSINGEIGTELRELLATIQGFKEITETQAKEAQFITKDDLERFLSTVQRIKEEEIKKAEEEAVLIINEAQQKAEGMVREAEGEAEKIKEEAALIINEAQQKAEGMVREAEGQAEKKKEQAALIIRKAQQKAEAIVREAEDEENRIKIALSELKKQHQFFKQRIKEVIELHLQLLGSVSEEEERGEKIGRF